jgi:thiamine biosynthesis lipoprotein
MHIEHVRFPAMASVHELQFAHPDPDTARAAAAAVVADVQRIEAKYSRYREDSVVGRINRAAGRDAVAIDSETAALFAYADECHRLSGGRFDITSGVLRRVWDFRSASPQLPAAAAIASVTTLIGWQLVERRRDSIRLPRAGMEIDLGGIGKEYAADRAATLCREHGIAHALINLGGDVRAVGPQPDGTPWRVGIRHPRRAGEAIATVRLTDGAVATSGDYERFVEIDGRRYCHLLDPGSCHPVSHWRSISVLAPLCIVAGSCATIAMLLEEGAGDFLAAQELAWLGVDAEGRLCGTAEGTPVRAP